MLVRKKLVNLIKKGLLQETWVDMVRYDLDADKKYRDLILDNLSENNGSLQYILPNVYLVEEELIFHYILQLENLEILKLEMPITRPLDLDKLPSLRCLKISTDSIKYISHSFKSLKLKKFRIEDNRLYYLPESMIHLQQLEYLSIYAKNLEINEETISLLSSLPLKELELARTELADNTNNFHLLNNLKQLTISAIIMENIPSSIFKLNNLEYLELCLNEITKVSKGIRKLQNLRELNLNGNFIQQLPKVMIYMDNLEKILIDSLKSIPIGMEHKIINLYPDEKY